MPLNVPLNRRLRMALLGGGGTGFIGKVHRIAATFDGRAELVAGAFSSDLMRSREAAVEFGVDPSRAFDSFEKLLDDEKRRPVEERVDFVTVATPNWLHFPMAKAVLEAGFHVMCDKPVTISVAQAEQLVSLVEQTGSVFGLTHNYTGYPLVRQAREMIACGELGQVTAVRVSYIQGWMRGLRPGDTPARGAWKDDPQKNGPAATMGDIGTHAFNLACYMTGLEPVEVSATLRTFSPGRQLDDYGHALVRFSSDALCMITVSQVTHGRLNDLRIEIDGETASLAWQQERPETLTLSRFGEPTQILHRHPSAPYTNTSGRAACRLPAGHPEAFFEAFANVYSAACDDMVRQICGGSSDVRNTLYPSIYDGLAGVRFIEQSIASSRARGIWLPLDGSSAAPA